MLASGEHSINGTTYAIRLRLFQRSTLLAARATSPLHMGYSQRRNGILQVCFVVQLPGHGSVCMMLNAVSCTSKDDCQHTHVSDRYVTQGEHRFVDLGFVDLGHRCASVLYRSLLTHILLHSVSGNMLEVSLYVQGRAIESQQDVELLWKPRLRVRLRGLLNVSLHVQNCLDSLVVRDRLHVVPQT